MYSWVGDRPSRFEVHMTFLPSGENTGSTSAPGAKVMRTGFALGNDLASDVEENGNRMGPERAENAENDPSVETGRRPKLLSPREFAAPRTSSIRIQYRS